MANSNYITKDARDRIASVLGIALPDSIGHREKIIEGTINGEDCVIVCFAIVVRTQPSEQRYIDLNSCTGNAWNNILSAWERAVSENKKFFFFATNHVDEMLRGYIFSIEASPRFFGNKTVYILANYLNDIHSNLIENSKRYSLSNGYLSVVKEDCILDYMSCFDNRPYLNSGDNIEVNPEEKNKRLFKYWMECQVKPEGDSDAGNPYAESSINMYISNIASTRLKSFPEKSVFYTIDAHEVQQIIEELDVGSVKNHTQRSALKKYAEYISTLTQNGDNHNDVLTHNLWGIHIKHKNNALSEKNPHICIGWSKLGDLSALHSTKEIADAYDMYYQKNNRGKGQDVGQIRRFVREINIGDYILFAESERFHIGKIESDYYYDHSSNPDQDPDYTNNRKVTWLIKDIDRKSISDSMHRSLATAMSVFGLNDYRSVVFDLLNGTYNSNNEDDREVSISLSFHSNVDIPYERNRIVFGAPGTGKSFLLKKDCDRSVDLYSATYERVTFHPDYSYAQFVGTYKPVMGDDQVSIQYKYVPGPFMRILAAALQSISQGEDKPYILIIEEINRAKVAAVFGEVFQLLDRDGDGVSEYEIQASEDIRRYLSDKIGGCPEDYSRLRIPNNMFIWATMNSADQGVFPMDTAFKRRWSFEYLGINENEDELRGCGKIILPGADEPVEWNVLRKAINAKMSSNDFKINEDKLMGPFFLSKKVTASDEHGMIVDGNRFLTAFKSKVLMYLYEDAVKQGKHRFFEGCDDRSRYSAVCEEFDKKGLAIFGPTFRETFYNVQKDES